MPLYYCPVAPRPAPRQNASDRWKNPPRPLIAKYRAYRDELRLWAQQNQIILPCNGMHIIFFLPMPAGWSKTKKASMAGKPHQLHHKFDVDNLLKAVFDTLCPDGDGHIWDVRASKFWAQEGGIFFDLPPSK